MRQLGDRAAHLGRVLELDHLVHLAEAETGRRPVWFGGFVETPVYWRDHLPADAVIHGPAIVEQMDTTIVIEPGDIARQDGDGNIIIAIGG